jgi:hypothetical protein
MGERKTYEIDMDGKGKSGLDEETLIEMVRKGRTTSKNKRGTREIGARMIQIVSEPN